MSDSKAFGWLSFAVNVVRISLGRPKISKEKKKKQTIEVRNVTLASAHSLKQIYYT